MIAKFREEKDEYRYGDAKLTTVPDIAWQFNDPRQAGVRRGEWAKDVGTRISLARTRRIYRLIND